jgi:hypothetical protein
MIQRKQTLFLLELIFLGIAILFLPNQLISAAKTSNFPLGFLPVKTSEFYSSPAHMAAIALNFSGIVFAFIAIFLYKKRNLQISFCYLSIVIWLTIASMVAFTSFINSTGNMIKVEKNFFAYIIAAMAILAGVLAARFIKKDIDLLKSADRIR